MRAAFWRGGIKRRQARVERRVGIFPCVALVCRWHGSRHRPRFSAPQAVGWGPRQKIAACKCSVIVQRFQRICDGVKLPALGGLLVLLAVDTLFWVLARIDLILECFGHELIRKQVLVGFVMPSPHRGILFISGCALR